MENVDKLLADGGIEAEPGPNEATTKAKDASEPRLAVHSMPVSKVISIMSTMHI